jgi:hypothetical protein
MPETFNSSLDENARGVDRVDEARANILKAAETYDALAQTIEDIAEQAARTRSAEQ